MTARRRRAVVLIALAMVAGGISASRVSGRAADIEAQVGSLVPVLVAGQDVAAGDRVSAGSLAIRQVPQRFVPADALSAPEQAVGRRAGAPVAAGGYLTAGTFASTGGVGAGEPPALARGQRSIEIPVAGGQGLTDAAPGTRVDVLVTTETRSGGGRSFLALQDVELLGVRATEDARSADGAAARASALATLRVNLRQAVYLTAAQSFAREVRLLVRAPGDRRSAPALEVGSGGLG